MIRIGCLSLNYDKPKPWPVATYKAPKPTCNAWTTYNIDRSANCNYSAEPSLVPTTTYAQKEPPERTTRTLRLDPFTTHAHVFSPKQYVSCMHTLTPLAQFSQHSSARLGAASRLKTRSFDSV